MVEEHDGQGGEGGPGARPVTIEALQAELERFRSKVNGELADRRKAIDALGGRLEEISKPREPEPDPETPDVASLWREIGGLERTLPAPVVERLRSRVDEKSPSVYATALRAAADMAELMGPKAGETPEASRGDEPARSRVRPPDAGGTHSAGTPRTYAELLKMPAAEKAAWRQRDPEGYARTSDDLYRDRFKKLS